MNRQRITTILTAVIVALWTVTAVFRLFHPWPEAQILDSAMPLVIGYWFVSNSTAKKNGNGMMPA